MKLTTFDPIRLSVAEIIFQSLGELSSSTGTAMPDLGVRDIYDSLVEPPNLDLGDLAFGCFVLAKAMRKSPAAVAQDLQKILEKN
jgi:arginyl-tRNA synthetase